MTEFYEDRIFRMYSGCIKVFSTSPPSPLKKHFPLSPSLSEFREIYIFNFAYECQFETTPAELRLTLFFSKLFNKVYSDFSWFFLMRLLAFFSVSRRLFYIRIMNTKGFHLLVQYSNIFPLQLSNFLRLCMQFLSFFRVLWRFLTFF